MIPTNRQPLFVVTGASCVGKSTVSEILFHGEKDYIVLESDIIWNNVYNSPETDYLEYRKVQLTLCANISQAGKPIVLCGCVTPKQFGLCDEKELFSAIYYLALVCDENTLEQRMRQARNVSDENWIEGSLEFNKWLKENADRNEIQLVNNTELSPEECAGIIDRWISSKLG
jgi:hypothetical protein